MPYHTIPYHTIPYHTIPYHTIPYHTIPYHTIPHHTIPYHTRPDHTRVFRDTRAVFSAGPFCSRRGDPFVIAPVFGAKLGNSVDKIGSSQKVRSRRYRPLDKQLQWHTAWYLTQCERRVMSAGIRLGKLIVAALSQSAAGPYQDNATGKTKKNDGEETF